MVKRRRDETDNHGTETTAKTTSYNTVFIDTNFNTHIALIVSDSDTVSDLKQNVMLEHKKCFPEMRELKIGSVKVNRKGFDYHLPDTMLVRCAFEGIKKGWFLSVDASSNQGSGKGQEGLLRLTYPQTEADNIRPRDSCKAIARQMVSGSNEHYPAHGNLVSSSTVKQKGVAKGTGEFSSIKLDISQELSPKLGPAAKKRKMMHREDVVYHTASTDTHTSKHRVEIDASHSKIVENGMTSANSNEGEQEHINMETKDVIDEPIRQLASDPCKMSKLGLKGIAGEASAEVSGVQDEQCGNRDNDTLEEESQSEVIANKVKTLGSKESSRGSTELNLRDATKIVNPEMSKAKAIFSSSALPETLEDRSLRTDTVHKKRKKKTRKDLSTCHDEVACTAPSSTEKFEGNRRLEQNEGADLKIFDKLTDAAGSTIHVSQSGINGITSPANNHASNEITINDGAMHESVVSDVANTSGELKELAPNCDLKIPMTEKFGDASTKDLVPSSKLSDAQPVTESSFRRKKESIKISTPCDKVHMELIVEGSQTVPNIVLHNHAIDTTRKDDINNIGEKDNLSVTRGAETMHIASDKNETTGATAEQILSAEKALDANGRMESGNTSNTKRKKKSRNKSAEKALDKLEQKDDKSRVSCNSSAAGSRPLSDHVSEQSKKGEILFAARQMQTSINTEEKDSLPSKEIVQVLSATLKSSDCSKAEVTIKKVETVSTALTDVKVAAGHETPSPSKKRRRRKKVGADDGLCTPSSMHNPPDNHLILGSNQNQNVSPTTERKEASKHESNSDFAAGSHQGDEMATPIGAELLPVEIKGIEVEHLLLNQTDKCQESGRILEMKQNKKTKKNKSSSKKSKAILASQDQESGLKDLAAPRDVNHLPESMEMGVLVQNKLENQLSTGVDSNSKAGTDFPNADSFQVPSHPFANGKTEVVHEPEVNTDKSESINFKQYFVPGQQQGEVASGKPTKSNRHTKAGKKSKERMASRNSSQDVLNSRTKVNVPSSSSVEGSKTLQGDGKLATVDAPAYKEEYKESMDESTSSSSSKGSERFPPNHRRQAGSETQIVATRKTNKTTGNIGDCTQPEKRLIPTSEPKFGNGRQKSADNSGRGNSDATTVTPSDSSSSGFSDGGSELSHDTTQNGANGARRKDGGAKPNFKSKLFGEDVTMDMIFRSSSRFKKAKVTAAKFQEDDGSQPVDVVPDSQL